MPGHMKNRSWKPYHTGQPKSSNQKSKQKKQVEQPINTRQTTVNGGIQVTDFFLETFRHLFTPTLQDLVQRVKHHLYKRDYKAAFGSQEHLEAYVVQWSVSRAMAYREMILEDWFGGDLRQLLSAQQADSEESSKNDHQAEGSQDDEIHIVCIGGGGGAEVVGFAAALSAMTPEALDKEDSTQAPKEQESIDRSISDLNLNEESESTQDSDDGTMPDMIPKKNFQSAKTVHLTAFDFGAWAPIIQTLQEAINAEPIIHTLHVPASHFKVDFDQQDVLLPLSSSSKEAVAKAQLITIFFTAGELYVQSPQLATKFLLSLYSQTRPGCMIVVVDSAGGFQDVNLRRETSAETNEDNDVETEVSGFKLGFILDKTLTHKGHWQKVVSEDAKWWRVPEILKEKGNKSCPLPLESMRCLVRVYKRSPGSS